MPFRIACALVLAVATPPPQSVDNQCRRIDSPGAAVRCATERSPAIDIAVSDVDVARARRDGARVVLPSHPTIDVVVAGRRGPTDRDINVYGTLRQEIEIGGQRKQRTRVADAEIEGRNADIAIARRRVAAAALSAYYDVVVAQRRGVEMGKVLEVARALESLASERLGAGASSGLEHELARAARVVAERRVLDARREAKVARVRLASMVGLASVEVAGELVPPAFATAHPRPELAGAAAKVRAHDRRTVAIKRERVPSPAFIVTVQRDGFNEFVAGGGISLGIPLPSPLGPNKRAEIAESRSLARRARADEALMQRSLAVEADSAAVELAARKETLALYEPAVITGARETLDALAGAMVAGQLDLRGALVAQESLLELLAGQIEAEYDLCIAAVDAAYAGGRDLEGAQ